MEASEHQQDDTRMRITRLSLGTYYHGLPSQFDQDHPIKVYFDDVVVARSYVGPRRKEVQ